MKVLRYCRKEGLDPRVAPELQANRDRKDLPEIKAKLDSQGSQVIQAVVARKVILDQIVSNRKFLSIFAESELSYE